MKPEEFIRLMWERAREHQRTKGQKEADEIINKISQNLYIGLQPGQNGQRCGEDKER